MEKPKIGTIGWVDLTVADADRIRTFYEEVVGWTASEVPMGEYSDFNMLEPETATPVAGICFAQGKNAGLPPQWLIYIVVADLETSMKRCRERGGEVIAGPSEAGGGRYCVVRDPAGAVAALYQE
jgi:uncharacterized protein